MKTMTWRAAWLAVLLLGAIQAPAAAQVPAAEAPLGAAPWPSRPIRLLDGFPPGGATDTLARLMAARLQALLGQPVVVENRPGAAGSIAAVALARSAPDGYTLGALAGAPLAVNRHVQPRVEFDPLADFAPVSEFARFPSILMVHPSTPVRSLAELGPWMRAQRPAAACASPGAGVLLHIATEMLIRAIEAPCDIVHYRGGAQAMPDFLAGRTQVYVDAMVTALPQIRDGKARPLAVTSAARSALAPGLPAIAETIPGFEAVSWLALAGPAGLPGPVVEILARAVQEAARDPAVQDRLRQLGAEPVGSTPAELAARIRAEDAKWGAVVRAAGITAN